MPSIVQNGIKYFPISKRGKTCNCTIGEEMKKCRRPAAVRIEMGGSPIYQCSICFNAVRAGCDPEMRGPTLKELRKLIGWES